MAYELLISFASVKEQDKALIKQRLIHWLEARGRFDYVEGIIDGVDTKLTDDEVENAVTSEGRLAVSPIGLFDDVALPLQNLSREMAQDFPNTLTCKITEISDESWLHCWQEDFVPLQTDLFWIVPLGDGSKTPEGLTRVEIDAAGGAFGTGQHSTTRAIIDVIDKNLPVWRPASLLDVGTGTGIYLVLAGLMGVRSLAGTEISEELVSLARSNCDLADVKADIRVADRPHFGCVFDVVIANILVPVLHDLMGDLRTHLAPRGRLIVAGFVEKEEGPLVRLAEQHGLVVEGVTSELGWRCVVFRLAV